MRRVAVVALVAVAAVVAWTVAVDGDPERRAGRGNTPATPPAARATRPPEPVGETEAPPSGVTGVVTDADGQVLAGADVRAHEVWPDDSTRRWNRGAASTDDRGAYAFEGLPPGRYAVQALHGTLRSPRRIVELDGAARVDLRVGPGPAELRIDLVPRHAGVDLATFTLQLHGWPEPRPSDAGGGWTLRGLHPGDVLGFRIGFEPDQFAWSARPGVRPKPGGSSQVYEVAVTETRQRYVVKVDRFAWVRGRLLGPAGESGGTVQVVSGEDFRTRDLFVGEFELRALPGRPLSVFAPGFGGLGTPQPIELPPLPGGGEHEVTLRLEELEGVVTGRVLDAEGRPLPRDGSFRVGVMLRIARHFAEASGTPDASGRVRIEGLARGTGEVRIHVGSDARWARPLPIPVDLARAAELDFGTVVLTRGGSIEGVVHRAERSLWEWVTAYPLDPRGEPIRSAGRRTKPEEDGAFRFERLAPARWEVTWGSGDARAKVTVGVTEAATTRVDVR